ncbi:MAG TPA: TlpA disulfide reductase family protein [Blastocatellia bacterium]|nr:TlpA disulfide reductase family protein [Blastocatellia bacterium]
MKLFILLTGLLLFSAPALTAQSAALAGAPADDSKSMISAKLTDLDGKTVHLDEMKGSILVVDFWATWCGPCIKEIPAYNELQQKYASQGVKIVGVTLASGEAKEVKPFVSRHNMKYTILMGEDSLGYDFRVDSFPTTYLVTRDWKVYRKYIGGGPAKTQQLEADIRNLLGQK